MAHLDAYLRAANKRWATAMSTLAAQEQAAQEAANASASVDACQQLRVQTLNDALYQLWVSCLMMEPIAPFGCQKICDFLNFDAASFFSWNHNFESVAELCGERDIAEGTHRVQELPARFDFFQREL